MSKSTTKAKPAAKAPASQPAKAPSRPAPSARSKEAQAAVAAALAEGKIAGTSLPAWRAAYERNPARVRAELRQLAAPRICRPGQAAAAPVGEAALLASTRKTLGLEPSASSAPLSHAPAPASAPRPPAQLTRTEHGNTLYGGVPTRMSDRGTPQVYYFDGWMDIAEFERRGLTPEQSAMAIQVTQQTGTNESRAVLNEGLPAGSALGVV